MPLFRSIIKMARSVKQLAKLAELEGVIKPYGLGSLRWGAKGAKQNVMF